MRKRDRYAPGVAASGPSGGFDRPSVTDVTWPERHQHELDAIVRQGRSRLIAPFIWQSPDQLQSVAHRPDERRAATAISDEFSVAPFNAPAGSGHPA